MHISRVFSLSYLVASLLILATLLPISSPAAALSIERIELHQKQSVQVEHRRRVGNSRTQAQAQGWIARVPQTYIYLSDFSAMFHMDGMMRGFERQLNARIDSLRTERSVIDLDRLLENAERPESGEEITLAELPPADLYVAFYSKPNCELCEEVDQGIVDWLETMGEISVVWLNVSLDQLL